jgi:hypothetical protein
MSPRTFQTTFVHYLDVAVQETFVCHSGYDVEGERERETERISVVVILLCAYVEVTSVLPSGPNRCECNTFGPYLSNIPCNTLPSTLWSSRWFLFSDFLTKILYPCLIYPHACYMPTAQLSS